MRSRLFIGAVLLSGAFAPTVTYSSTGADVCEAPTCGKIFYFNTSRTYYGKFNDKYWIMGPVYPDHPLIEQNKRSFEPFVLTLTDCSNKKFRCISAWDGVFAIPRGRMSPNLKYSISGSLFSIERCIQGNAKTCQVALISSKPAKSSGGEYADSGLRDGFKNTNLVIYFIYNEDIGISAFGEVKKVLAGDAKMRAASQFVLSGNIGLLGPRERGDMVNVH